jgi:hypothetical protein
MARPFPKAILFQMSDSLGVTTFFSDTSYNSMFDGAKNCPKMNTDLPSGSSLRLKSGPYPALADFDDNLIQIPENREINSEFLEFEARIIEFCPKFVNLVLEQGINREFCRIAAIANRRWDALFLHAFRGLEKKVRNSATIMSDTRSRSLSVNSSWPAPSTITTPVGAGISLIAACSSPADPNGSRVPWAKRAGVWRRGKCAVRSCNGLRGGCSGYDSSSNPPATAGSRATSMLAMRPP